MFRSIAFLALAAGLCVAWPNPAAAEQNNNTHNRRNNNRRNNRNNNARNNSRNNEIRPEQMKDWNDLSWFAQHLGFTVTSTTNGRPGNKPYRGRAIDVRTKDKTPAEVDHFILAARAAGIKVVDARTRPRNGAHWMGPHLHLEAPQ